MPSWPRKTGTFDLTDVYRTLGTKIIRRHPHVFGDLAVSGVDQVVTNWETIKSSEREDAGRPPASFGDVARTLPALPASREIQERASALGWDWPDVVGVWEKVGEELDELRAAASEPSAPEERIHELGDVLFAMANLARWLGVDPEEALRLANRRWLDRYAAVEALAASRGLVLADLDADAEGRAVERGQTMSATRVAIVAHASLPDDPRIRRHAEALRDAGHEVDLIGLRDPGQRGEERVERECAIVRLPIRRQFTGFAGHLAEYLAFAALAAVRLAVEHRHRRYRLVQVATLPDFLAFAALPVRLTGVPLLLDLHEDMPEFFRDRFASGGLRPLFPLISGTARASAAVADAVITVHEPLRQLAIGRGVAPDRIAVVMNSADERLFDPAAHPRRAWRADGTLRLVHTATCSASTASTSRSRPWPVSTRPATPGWTCTVTARSGPRSRMRSRATARAIG